MTRPRLSLSMIAGSDSDVLGRCLDSAAPFVDEMVVVCNGDEATEQLARDHGATVYRDVWDKDFARARQVSLDYCTGDWVLMLDADEWLDRATGAQLRALIGAKVPWPTVYGIQIKNLFDKEGAVTHNISYRGSLFPRHPDIRWIRPIHEQVSYIPNPDALHYVETDRVVLWHDGYLTAPWLAKGKTERNTSLLWQEIDAHPDEPYHWHNLGRQLVADEQHAQALQIFERCFELLKEHPESTYQVWVAESYLMATTAAVGANNFRRAIAIGDAALGRYPDYAEVWNNVGAACNGLGDFRVAISYLEQARALRTKQHAHNRDPGASTWRPARHLAQSWLGLGEPVRAIEWLTTAIDEAPAHALLEIELAIPLASIGELEEAEAVLKRVLVREPENVAARRLLGGLPRVKELQEAQT